MFAFFVFDMESLRMFDFVRKHTKIMMFMMFLLIIPGVRAGRPRRLQPFRTRELRWPASTAVDITQAEWDFCPQERSRPHAGLDADAGCQVAGFTGGTLRNAGTAGARSRAGRRRPTKLKLVTSDAVWRAICSRTRRSRVAAQARWHTRHGAYRQLVASQGMTPEMFEAQVRADLSSRQVLAGVMGSGFTPAVEANVALNAFLQKREVQVARFSPSDFTAKVTLTDAEIEAFYKQNEALFQAPEQASIEYVVLDLETVKKSLVVNEADLKTYYEQNATRLSGQEERRASHILISAPKTASAEDRKRARAKADEVLAAARKAPDSFADLARKNSQDTGSAPNGGDLDFFARGAMVKAFEDTAFSMKKGDVSDVVESEFGYHIIRLTDIKAPKVRTFDEMKAQIESDLKKQQAQRKFAEVADAFTNGVYEQADSLKPVADRLKLEVQSAANVTRTPAPGANGVLASPKLLNAIFASDAVEKKRNTEAVETAPNQLVSARIVQYMPARTKPLAEVKDAVRARLVAERGAELARKDGAAKLAAWQANPASADLPAPLTVSREQSQQFPGKLIDAVLRADAAALPVLVGVDLGGQGYAVARVNKVIDFEPANEAARRQNLNQYNQLWTGAESLAYFNELKRRF
jgi:peptidyl-prolyl cis-trans isomerase D